MVEIFLEIFKGFLALTLPLTGIICFWKINNGALWANFVLFALNLFINWTDQSLFNSILKVTFANIVYNFFCSSLKILTCLDS
jgi:hypothetical protein